MSEQDTYEDFKPQKGKKSGIWNYFHFKVNRLGTREKGHVYCKICDCALSYNTCTTNMWKHHDFPLRDQNNAKNRNRNRYNFRIGSVRHFPH